MNDKMSSCCNANFTVWVNPEIEDGEIGKNTFRCTDCKSVCNLIDLIH